MCSTVIESERILYIIKSKFSFFPTKMLKPRKTEFPGQGLSSLSAAELRLKPSSPNPRIILKLIGKSCGKSFSEQALFHPERLCSHKPPAGKGVSLKRAGLRIFRGQALWE